MIECEYVIFVTIIDERNLLRTVCFYARDRLLAEALERTLREIGWIGPEKLPIRNVAVAKL